MLKIVFGLVRDFKAINLVRRPKIMCNSIYTSIYTQNGIPYSE